jgi:hypothetical protein
LKEARERERVSIATAGMLHVQASPNRQLVCVFENSSVLSFSDVFLDVDLISRES